MSCLFSQSGPDFSRPGSVLLSSFLYRRGINQFAAVCCSCEVPSVFQLDEDPIVAVIRQFYYGSFHGGPTDSLILGDVEHFIPNF